MKRNKKRKADEKRFLSDLLGLILDNRRLVLASIATLADLLR